MTKNEKDFDMCSRIVRVIIAGNSLAEVQQDEIEDMGRKEVSYCYFR